jgi:hypothetical protein
MKLLSCYNNLVPVNLILTNGVAPLITEHVTEASNEIDAVACRQKYRSGYRLSFVSQKPDEVWSSLASCVAIKFVSKMANQRTASLKRCTLIGPFWTQI